jgi:hypothetical protein
MAAFLGNGWVEDVGTWLLGLAFGFFMAHRHLVKPARQRHTELLAAHDRLHERIKGLEGP